MINIKGIDKAEVLLGLYNNSHQQGMGFLQPNHNLTIDEAKELLENYTYFDYLYGRVLKVDLSNDEEFEESLYDRDNGDGAAQRVIDKIKGNYQKNESNDQVQIDSTISPKTSHNNYQDQHFNEYIDMLLKLQNDFFSDNMPKNKVLTKKK